MLVKHAYVSEMTSDQWSAGRLLRRAKSAVVAFHNIFQHTAHAARETYAIEGLQSMRSDRTVTINAKHEIRKSFSTAPYLRTRSEHA